MRRMAMGVFLVVLLATSQVLANWPHWRGPSLNGVSKETGLPLKWSATEGIAWKLPMPSRSGATPIIWGDLIFLNVATAQSTGELELWAVDRNKKDVIWKRPIAGGNNQQRKQNMSSPSPVTDGTHVWVMSGVGILKAFDFKGTEKWSRDIQKDYGRFGLNWGYASSPLLHAGALYVPVLHGMKTDDPSYVLKIEAATGKTLWHVVRATNAIRESPDAYTTPALLEYGGKTEIVITGGDVVTGHDPSTGQELWRADGLNPDNNPNYRIVASPIIAGDLIIAPTRERPILAIRPGGRGDVTGSHIAWTFPQRGPDVPSPVSDGTYVYLVTDNGVVWCLDRKSGAVVYGPERLASDLYSSSPVIADGKIYVTSENSGITSVYKTGPKFELLAQNTFDDYTLSSVAISQGQIFIRTQSALWVIGDRRTNR
jgi:outer membrane protein assembly factor BamB